MAALRELLETQGCSEVRTLLNSGNAVFRSVSRSATGDAEAIAAGLQGTLGVDVVVVVKSSSEFSAAVAENPLAFPESHCSRFLVAFGQSEAATQRLSALRSLLAPPDQLHIGRHAAYLYCAGGIMESKAGTALLGKLGREITTRNWATVLKLNALLDGGIA